MAEARRAGVAGDDVLQQAAEWFAVLGGTPGDDERQRWRQWLVADPRHAAAWRRVEALNQRFEALPAGVDRPAAVRALAAAGASDGRRRSLKALAVAGVAGAVGWLALRDEPWQRWMADARTGVGEQRELVLPDGTRVWLNTDTALQVRYDDQRRDVHLLRGEVMVATAPDPAPVHRPWELVLDEGRLRPLGTRFGVQRDEAGCQLAVFEGAVEVLPRAGTATATLPAGHELRFDARSIGARRPVSAAREAWTRGVLVADGMTLGEFCRELGRYQPGLLTCAPAVASLRLVGAFPLADAARIYQALERSLPVRVQRPLPWWVRIQPA